ncbi:hypothetical protein BZA70DRAFT_270856 [Myxozyma melibiosi]|uniref:Uncharacterized protein n=1 Tax=Myxozyma melibiosi TaxID=54550 RepID=A0ABR1FBN3_9ASCO
MTETEGFSDKPALLPFADTNFILLLPSLPFKLFQYIRFKPLHTRTSPRVMARTDISMTIKVKRGKETVLLLLSENDKFSTLKKQVYTAFKTTLSTESKDDDEDDLAIPKPSFETSTTSAAAEESEKSKGSSGTDLAIEDLIIGLPVDKTDYSKGWKPASEDASAKALKALEISDGTVLAFRIKDIDSDTDFEVEFPTFEDDVAE